MICPRCQSSNTETLYDGWYDRLEAHCRDCGHIWEIGPNDKVRRTP